MKKTMLCNIGTIIGLALLTSGCASMNLSKSMPFSQTGTTVAKQMSLYASPETQAFVVEKDIFGGPPMGRSYRIPVGEALLPNAEHCLASVCESVDTLSSLSTSREAYTVELDFPEKGDIDIGLTSFSASPVTLSLRARVRTRDGGVIWAKTVKKTASAKSRWQIAAIIPIFGALGHDTAMVLAAEKSLQECLEAVRDGILQDKDVFLKGHAK